MQKHAGTWCAILTSKHHSESDLMNQVSQPLEGQAAVVTGAGRGIGAAIAQHLSQLGAAVILGGRTRQRLTETANQISKLGGRAEVVELDVTSLPSTESLARFVREK